ncbi:hypothetical protein NicSoilB4_17660 [Arthrobacter sp. NicSoilB4]|nr:hypothetical protein NicSoilB4_17660 [Arthrobacter sp. NicSoilB4]
MMFPLDSSEPSDFSGVDFAAYFQGPSVYDGKAVSNRVMDLVEQYLTQMGLSSRRCFHGGFGAAAGGPAFPEVLLWVQEHWEFLAGAASVVLARVANIRDKWRKLKKAWEERILDPYKPSVLVELGARTQSDGDEGRTEAAQSFRALLTHVPDISELLRRELPDQTFTMVVRTLGPTPANTYAHFNAPDAKQSDVTKVVRYLEKQDLQEGYSTLRLYRKFGFLRRVESSESGDDFVRMTVR